MSSAPSQKASSSTQPYITSSNANTPSTTSQSRKIPTHSTLKASSAAARVSGSARPSSSLIFAPYTSSSSLTFSATESTDHGLGLPLSYHSLQKRALDNLARTNPSLSSSDTYATLHPSTHRLPVGLSRTDVLSGDPNLTEPSLRATSKGLAYANIPPPMSNTLYYPFSSSMPGVYMADRSAVATEQPTGLPSTHHAYRNPPSPSQRRHTPSVPNAIGTTAAGALNTAMLNLPPPVPQQELYTSNPTVLTTTPLSPMQRFRFAGVPSHMPTPSPSSAAQYFQHITPVEAAVPPAGAAYLPQGSYFLTPTTLGTYPNPMTPFQEIVPEAIPSTQASSRLFAFPQQLKVEPQHVWQYLEYEFRQNPQKYGQFLLRMRDRTPKALQALLNDLEFWGLLQKQIVLRNTYEFVESGFFRYLEATSNRRSLAEHGSASQAPPSASTASFYDSTSTSASTATHHPMQPQQLPQPFPFQQPYAFQSHPSGHYPPLSNLQQHPYLLPPSQPLQAHPQDTYPSQPIITRKFVAANPETMTAAPPPTVRTAFTGASAAQSTPVHGMRYIPYPPDSQNAALLSEYYKAAPMHPNASPSSTQEAPASAASATGYPTTQKKRRGALAPVVTPPQAIHSATQEGEALLASCRDNGVSERLPTHRIESLPSQALSGPKRGVLREPPPLPFTDKPLVKPTRVKKKRESNKTLTKPPGGETVVATVVPSVHTPTAPQRMEGSDWLPPNATVDPYEAMATQVSCESIVETRGEGFKDVSTEVSVRSVLDARGDAKSGSKRAIESFLAPPFFSKKPCSRFEERSSERGVEASTLEMRAALVKAKAVDAQKDTPLEPFRISALDYGALRSAESTVSSSQGVVSKHSTEGSMAALSRGISKKALLSSETPQPSSGVKGLTKERVQEDPLFLTPSLTDIKTQVLKASQSLYDQQQHPLEGMPYRRKPRGAIVEASLGKAGNSSSSSHSMHRQPRMALEPRRFSAKAKAEGLGVTYAPHASVEKRAVGEVILPKSVDELIEWKLKANATHYAARYGSVFPYEDIQACSRYLRHVFRVLLTVIWNHLRHLYSLRKDPAYFFVRGLADATLRDTMKEPCLARLTLDTDLQPLVSYYKQKNLDWAQNEYWKDVEDGRSRMHAIRRGMGRTLRKELGNGSMKVLSEVGEESKLSEELGNDIFSSLFGDEGIVNAVEEEADSPQKEAKEFARVSRSQRRLMNKITGFEFLAFFEGGNAKRLFPEKFRFMQLRAVEKVGYNMKSRPLQLGNGQNTFGATSDSLNDVRNLGAFSSFTKLGSFGAESRIPLLTSSNRNFAMGLNMGGSSRKSLMFYSSNRKLKNARNGYPREKTRKIKQ